MSISDLYKKNWKSLPIVRKSTDKFSTDMASIFLDRSNKTWTPKGVSEVTL